MRLLKRLFQGRINIANYLLGLFIVVALLSITNIFQENIIRDTVSTVAIIFLLSITSRRFHDIGRSALSSDWWNVTFYVFRKGQKKVNRYGLPPKGKINIKTLFGF